MTRAADIARADVEESKRSGPPDSAAGRGWSAVILVATDLFDYLDWQQRRPRAGAGKVVRLTPQAPCLRAAGPPTTSAARGVGGARRRGVPGRPAHHSAPARVGAPRAGRRSGLFATRPRAHPPSPVGPIGLNKKGRQGAQRPDLCNDTFSIVIRPGSAPADGAPPDRLEVTTVTSAACSALAAPSAGLCEPRLDRHGAARRPDGLSDADRPRTRGDGPAVRPRQCGHLSSAKP